MSRFPTIQETKTGSETSNTTSHVITMPDTISAYDLIVVYFAIDKQPVTLSYGSYDGMWAYGSTNTYSGYFTFRIYYLIVMEDDEASLTINSTVAGQSVHIAHRITGINTSDPDFDGFIEWVDSFAGMTNYSTNATIATSNLEYGTQDYTFLVGVVMDSGYPSVAPADFTGLTTQDTTSGLSVSTVYRQYRTVTSYSPGDFSSPSARWYTQSVSLIPQLGAATFPYKKTTQVDPGVNLLTDLYVVYKLEETSGTTAYDSLGGYNGVTNAVVGATGKEGYCETFVRVNNDYISFAGDAGDMELEDFSYSCWIKFGAAGVGNYCGVLGNFHEDWQYWYLVVNDGPSLHAVCNFDDYNISAYSNDVISTDTWYNVVVTHDRDGYMTMYVNGVEQTLKGDISSYAATSFNIGMGLTIGNIGWLNSWYFEGSIDEVYIYKGRILTQSDITALQTSFYPFT